jgi:hypothetical protein
VKWKIHDVFHINILSEAVSDTIPHWRKPTPPPVKVNDEDFWVMEKYIDARWFRNRFQFKIRWDGFSEEHDTWENTDDIDSNKGPQILDEGDEDLDLEVDFYRRHPNAAKRTDPPAAHKQPTRRRRTRH